MTFDEIKRIPDLDIEVTPLVEDAFYFLKALGGELSEHAGQKAVERLQQKGYSEEEIRQALDIATRMMENIKKYGVACAEWI